MNEHERAIRDFLAQKEKEDPGAMRRYREQEQRDKATRSVDDKLVAVTPDVETFVPDFARRTPPSHHRDPRHTEKGAPAATPTPPAPPVAESVWARTKEARIWSAATKKRMSYGDIAKAEKMTKNAVKQAVFMARAAIEKLKATPGWRGMDALLDDIATQQVAVEEWRDEDWLVGEELAMTYDELSYSLDHPEAMGPVDAADEGEFFPEDEFE